MAVVAHPELFVVEQSEDFGTSEYRTTLRAKQAFAAGQVMAKLDGERNCRRHYTTLQYGPSEDDNIRPLSELVYVNHSCEPNAAFDLSSKDPEAWHLRALKDIAPGDDITFFYPSTEWELDQPFECCCKTESCLGLIRGAKCLSLEALMQKGYASPWILERLQEKECEGSEDGAGIIM